MAIGERSRDAVNMLSESIQRASDKLALKNRRQQLQDEFSELDCEKITALPDKDLASWQANFEQDTPQWRFAEHAWQVRLLTAEIKAMQSAANKGLWGALIGAGVTLVSAVVGVWATGFFSHP